MKTASPLRYPGGKWRLWRFFSRLIEINDLRNCEYIEPYAGGGSLALTLLRSGLVSHIHLNDLAPPIYWVWWAMLEHGNRLINFVGDVPLTLTTWREQRETYSRGPSEDPFTFACAVFYLNRTNHSGILNGGVIGGQSQSGSWLIDARFNRSDLISRIQYVSDNKDRISLHNRDAVEFLHDFPFHKNMLTYLDPPYVNAGKALYLNSYAPDDHRKVWQAVAASSYNWVVSYDDVPFVREIYKGYRSRQLVLLHTAREARRGREVLYFSPELKIPRKLLSQRLSA
jgi:DNA adenine methylase